MKCFSYVVNLYIFVYMTCDLYCLGTKNFRFSLAIKRKYLHTYISLLRVVLIGHFFFLHFI